MNFFTYDLFDMLVEKCIKEQENCSYSPKDVIVMLIDGHPATNRFYNKCVETMAKKLLTGLNLPNDDHDVEQLIDDAKLTIHLSHKTGQIPEQLKFIKGVKNSLNLKLLERQKQRINENRNRSEKLDRCSISIYNEYEKAQGRDLHKEIGLNIEQGIEK